MTQGIEGKIVVITGASSGLGEATARLLSKQGAAVAFGALQSHSFWHGPSSAIWPTPSAGRELR